LFINLYLFLVKENQISPIFFR